VTSARVAWPRAAILFGLGYFLIDPTWPMAIVLFPVFTAVPALLIALVAAVALSKVGERGSSGSTRI
jgi:hypothetical protein